MELFAKLYSSLPVFVYHCFDRIVIHGYLSGLSRPEQVVYFFRDVLGMPVVDKQVLRQRTNDYQKWVEAYARKRRITSYPRCAGWRRPTLTASGGGEQHVLDSLETRWSRAEPLGFDHRWLCGVFRRRIVPRLAWRLHRWAVRLWPPRQRQDSGGRACESRLTSRRKISGVGLAVRVLACFSSYFK
jgi:hypothetical protein